MENEMIWTIGIAGLALALVIAGAGTYLNNLVATTVREEWSEAGLARHIRSLHRLVFLGLFGAAVAGMIAGGFIFVNMNSSSWDDSWSSSRNTIDPPEWICRE